MRWRGRKVSRVRWKCFGKIISNINVVDASNENEKNAWTESAFTVMGLRGWTNLSFGGQFSAALLVWPFCETEKKKKLPSQWLPVENVNLCLICYSCAIFAKVVIKTMHSHEVELRLSCMCMMHTVGAKACILQLIYFRRHSLGLFDFCTLPVCVCDADVMCFTPAPKM